MPRRRILLSRISALFALVAYYMAGYFALNVFNTQRSYYLDMALPFEATVPFVPAFVIPYSLVFALIFVGFFSIPVDNLRLFQQGARLLAVNVTICFVLFLVTPVRALHRPDLTLVGTPLTDLAAFWFWLDQPTNLFPSLHVNVALISALVAWRHNRWLGGLTLVAAAAVAVSTIFVKQHYVADVLAAALLAGLTYWWLIVREAVPALASWRRARQGSVARVA